MLRVGTSGLCVALVVASLASAESRPGVTARRDQISALRKEERAIIKAIKARYGAIKRVDRLTQQELRQERAQIKKQEEQALALATSPEERKEIRKFYDPLRRHLTKGVKLEEREIRLLTERERSHIQYIKGLYTARIRQLEEEIRLLQSSGKKR